MYVCVCNAVSDREVKKALAEGDHSLRSLRERLGYASSCGRCTRCLREIIETHGGGMPVETLRTEPARVARCG